MSHARSGPPPAKDPRGFARVAVFGVLWSLCLIALAVVAGHDALAYAGATSAEPWIEQVLGVAEGAGPQAWFVAAGVAAVLVGLVLTLVAIRPRPYVGQQVEAKTGVFVLDRGLRNLAAATASDVDGVDTAQATTNRRSIRVTIRGLSADRDRELEQRVTQALEARLEPLRTTPRVRVRDLGKSG